MSTAENWKSFQDEFQKLTERNKSIQNTVKKLASSKKDGDTLKLKQDLSKQLEEATSMLQNLQKKATNTAEPENSNTEPSKGDPKKSNRPRLNPDESETAYELKQQMMKTVEVQNSKLRAELSLHEKTSELKHLQSQNKKLQEESHLTHGNTMKLLQRFEKKAKESDQKLKGLEDELLRANRLAFRYKDMYDQERQKTRGKRTTNVHSDEKDDKSLANVPLQYKQNRMCVSASLLGSSIRINDVIRKNENLLEENDNLKRDVAKYRQENTALLKKAKHAMTDRDTILHEMETCRMSRDDTLKRYHKEKAQHQQLTKSLERRAEDETLERRQLHVLEESARWKVIYNERTGPISPYASGPRYYVHSVPKNVNQPRGMMPVKDYATANHSTT